MHSHNDYFSQNTQNANWASNNSQALADLKFRNRMLMKHEYKSIMHCILQFIPAIVLNQSMQWQPNPSSLRTSFLISNGFPKLQASQKTKDTLPI